MQNEVMVTAGSERSDSAISRFVQRVTDIPLRVLLVLATVALVAFGLCAASVVVTTTMRSALMERVDEGLIDAVTTWAQPKPPRPEAADDAPPGLRRPKSPYFVQSVHVDGTVDGPFYDGESRPDLPSLSASAPAVVTVGSQGGGPNWRVARSSNEYGTAYVAIELADVDATMKALVVRQLWIGLATIVVMGLLALLVTRRALRPLARVERTALAIAQGDMSRRLEVDAPATEVGRLSLAFNNMLDTIDSSFRAEEAARLKALQSEERMRQFVNDASHELRTPLTSIRGFVELNAQGADVGIDSMQRIGHEAARMNELVEDLLLLARLDAYRPDRREVVDFLSTATNCLFAVRAAAPGRQVELLLLDDSRPITVLGDGSRLRQVFLNLLFNAVRHTPADAAITIELTIDDSTAIVRVSDTGPGMPPEVAEHVFDRFYQRDNSRHRTTDADGSGLGLSIASGIVEAHGGTITLDTIDGQGATFTVALPLAQ